MDKNPKKKPMFVMKETLVNLTPHQMGQAQGAHGGALGESPTECQNTCYYTCYYTY
jgi:hypothetical protein